MPEIVQWVAFAAACAAMSWAAGYLIAMEDLVGGQRHRFENWAYRVPDEVRSGDDQFLWEIDLFWDRAQYWVPFRKRNKVAVEAGADPRSTAGPLNPGLPGGVSRWTYRGACSIGLNRPSAERRVPHRDPRNGVLVYGVPLVDGQPVGRLDRAATILRGKAADLWGCPKCSGMWGGMTAALVLSHETFGFGWAAVVAAQLAGWGVARRIGWSE